LRNHPQIVRATAPGRPQKEEPLLNLIHKNLTIRNANPSDAEQLCTWWNDGSIMAHAGFPNGTNSQPESIRKSLLTDTDETRRRHIIELTGHTPGTNNSPPSEGWQAQPDGVVISARNHTTTPIGEMSYSNKGSNTAEIGIKICEPATQNKGYGTTLLAIFINALFTYYNYETIILDTNAKNLRAQHVYEKLGFTKTAARENAWQNQLGEWQTAIDYELTKSAWLANPKAPQYIHIRLEREADRCTTEEISRDAHWEHSWDMEPNCGDVHLLVHRLRQSPCYLPQLHFVAELNGKLAGHIQYAKSKIITDAEVPNSPPSEGCQAKLDVVVNPTQAEHEMLTFGPLSILPEHQGLGIGKALIRFTLAEAARQGYRAVFIFGHPDYYPRAGFRRAEEFSITTASGTNSDPFMAYPLYEGALDGITGRLILDPVYENLTPEDCAEFDKKFPPKELHTPIPATVLINRLPEAAQTALAKFKHKSLQHLSTQSEHAISNTNGMTPEAVELFRTIMHQNGVKWGK